MMRVLLDGDILVFRCGFAAEKGEYILTYTNSLGDEVDEAYTYKKDLEARISNLGLSESLYSVSFTRHAEPVENALSNVKHAVEKVLEALSADKQDLTLYLSGQGNFRYDIATLRPYKGNRDKLHRPTHEEAIREYMIRYWPCVVTAGEEADDAIGIEATRHYKKDPYACIIASTDKDLDMIPGLHYNFVREESYFVDELEALRKFYKQLLTGDSTDNIVGVPGIGPKKAAALIDDLTDEPNMYQVVREEYVKAYEDSPDAALLENARLLWIRQEEGQLWSPPTTEEQNVHSTD